MILAYYGETPRPAKLMSGTFMLSGVCNITQHGKRVWGDNEVPLPLGLVYSADWIYDTDKKKWHKNRNENPDTAQPMSDRDLTFNLLQAKKI